eukprot:6391831-Pyramimonas_sp.AAC.1
MKIARPPSYCFSSDADQCPYNKSIHPLKHVPRVRHRLHHANHRAPGVGPGGAHSRDVRGGEAHLSEQGQHQGALAGHGRRARRDRGCCEPKRPAQKRYTPEPVFMYYLTP